MSSEAAVLRDVRLVMAQPLENVALSQRSKVSGVWESDQIRVNDCPFNCSVLQPDVPELLKPVYIINVLLMRFPLIQTDLLHSIN